MTATASGVAAYVGARLSGFKRQRGEYRGPCPLHGGRRDSFAVNASTGLWRCHSECDRGGDLVELEMQLTGAAFAEAAQAVERLTGAATTNGSSASRIVATYNYTDAIGDLLYQVVRLEPKSFRQRRPNGCGGWVWGLGDVERVLYRLPRVLAADEVIVVEGEKDADTLERLGFVATTNSGGASQPWRDGYTAALQGKRVYIIPDADDPGRKHATKVRQALDRKATSCKVVKLPEGFKDATEYIEAGHGAGDVRQLMDAPEREKPRDEPKGYDAELDRLAALPPIEYDREREAGAERLGCRIGTLDSLVKARRVDGGATEAAGGSPMLIEDPEPWPSPVDGAALLSELAERVRRHVMMSAAAADAVALWIVHSHAHDSAAISPIIAITSPAPECGKTTTLGLLGAVVPRAMTTANITTAALFRVVELARPTLLIDEGDTFIRAGDELRGVLNSGHGRTSAFVVRTVGDDHEPRRFATWAPKAIALIGNLPATLASRSIHVELRRLAPGETVEAFRADRPPADLNRLRCQAWRWSQDHLDELRNAEPEMPGGLRGRGADNWRHLLAIADAAGSEWPTRARAAAVSLAVSRGEGEDDAITTALLADLRDLFDERGEDRLLSSEIVEHLGSMEERPWPEWGKQRKPITTRNLAQLLKPFGVEPRSVRTGPGPKDTAKGYHLADLKDTFARYLTSPSVTASQGNSDKGSSDFRSVTPERAVTDGNQPKALSTKACDAVTHREGGTAREVL